VRRIFWTLLQASIRLLTTLEPRPGTPISFVICQLRIEFVDRRARSLYRRGQNTTVVMRVSAPILATKLNIGKVRPTLVNRTRLLKLLEGTLSARLALITAPPGAGKTTSLTAWAARHPNLVAWFTIDENDNSLTRFLLCCEAALQTVIPEIGKETRSYLASDLAEIQAADQMAETFFTLLINDVTKLRREVVLVLDDYHAITLDAVHNAMNFLLRNLPANMHVIIASRSEPPLPLARLRARGELIELKQADLRFTSDEIREFFERLGYANLPNETIHNLQNRTEGWAAGLQLVALSAREAGTLAHINAIAHASEGMSGTHRYIADYLLDEVFHQQAPGLQQFLLQTGILNQLTAGLCDAVIERTGSQSLLEQIEQANLFTMPLDNKRQWYRYHQLFADFLRDLLQKTAPERALHLHRRAAAWYHQAGMLTEAIAHYLNAASSADAADLIEEYIRVTINIGLGHDLLHWLEALPEALILTRPVLCLIYAGLLTSSGRRDRMDQIQGLLQAAYQQLADGQDAKLMTALPAIMSLVDGDMPTSIAQSRKTLDELMEQAPLLRGVLALNLGYAYRLSGDLRMATYLYQEASILNRSAGQPQSALMALCQQGYLEVFSGELRKAHGTFRQATRLIDDLPLAERPAAIMALIYIGLSQVLYSWNDLSAAAYHANEGLQFGAVAEPQVALLAHIAAIRVFTAQREIEQALATLERAEALIQTYDLSAESIALLKAYRVRLWLVENRLPALQQWTQALLANEAILMQPGHEVELLTLVASLNARKQHAEALRLLTEALTLWQPGEARANRSTLIEALVTEALLHQATAQADRAVMTLSTALTLAEAGGYVREFIDAGNGVATLLRQSSVAYARVVLGHFEEKLSERELELLHLIADGLHNQDIATKLVVTAETVKWHLKNIYRKLGVASRTEAIREARARHLLT
jgi:LuxR family transcriptional regulator, maltose regulon positive regulatory protein